MPKPVSPINTLFIVILLSFIMLSQSKDITLACQNASTTQCASGFKFRLTGTNLTTTYCLPEGRSCVAGTTNQVTLSNCTNDFKDQNCTTRVCFNAVSKKVCTSDFPSCNATADRYDYDCATCENVPLCPQCFIGSKNDDFQSEVCASQKCGTTLNDVQSEVETCTVDDLGFNCGCCISNPVNASLSICTSTNDALQLQEVLNWARGINNTNNTNTTGGGLFEVRFGALMTIFAIIIASFMI